MLELPYLKHVQSLGKRDKVLFDEIYSIKPGETKSISFKLTPEELSLVNGKGENYQPKGKIDISIGGGQPDQKVVTTSNFVKGTITVQ